ncbi:HD domain-containing phosphohydrolase [Fusibacter sp. 3D3]|uniref:HD domain-containing phosphohydrolase n=1 Tax=Fusibacter sp. 3D3 TaxID=1048380 RepID=UPI0008538CF5|nr:HD domain-containing phosphohydrolase [Fusibacter sp. 3D3]GAU77540.1 HAMP domain/GAF domain/HD domain protein [Fusibacter sp. 3D3]
MSRDQVVIIDDEIEILNAIRRILKDEPYDILYFSDASEAMSYVADNNVDVILSDQRMPLYTGLDIILHAKRKSKAISGILMSGYTDFDVVVAAVNDGEITNYLTKPFDSDRLKYLIKQGIQIKKDKDEMDIIKQFKLLDQDQLEKTQTYLDEEQQNNLELIIGALSKLIEAKDPELYEHSKRVSSVALFISKQLGLSNEESLFIRLAAQVHDLGKISLRDQIVYKASSLSENEYLEMKKHPVVGAEILRQFQINEQLVKIVEQHHERVDGKGYPGALTEQNIVIGAKILAVADAYDAITSDRVYRKGLSKEEALEIITKASGSIYDETIVKAFISGLNS